MNSEQPLKQCPFCDGSATRYSFYSSDYMSYMWVIQCSKCLAQISHTDKNAVTAKWQKRVSEKRFYGEVNYE